jgi:orotidine-5'-phosphate decarboxylase
MQEASTMSGAAAPGLAGGGAAEPGHFADRLHAAIERTGSPACVGIDPVLERLPSAVGRRPAKDQRPAGAADSIEAFCLGVVDAAADAGIAIVKPQSACFERFGQSGIGVLKRVIQHAHTRGLLVILDAKRGDIGTTADHYAAAAFGSEKSNPAQSADALTVNGYMGPDTIEPFLGSPSRGVFVLVRTSNPGSDAIQAQRLADGRTVAELVADEVARLGSAPARIGACGLSGVGAVVGATKSSEGAALRARMPSQVFLVPGYGAQGGTLEDLKPLLRSNQAADSGIVVNASRSVIFAAAQGNADWRGAVKDAATKLADELRSLFR